MSEQETRIHEPSLAETQLRRTKSRRTLLAIVAVALLPMVAAYVVFFTGIGVPSGTVNNGVLLERALGVDRLMSHEVFQKITTEKKWRLFLPIPASCDSQCEQNLYTTRQVHIRLADKSKRLERYAVNIGGDQGAAFLRSIADEHPLLKSIDVEPADWAKWRAQSAILAAEDQAFYLLVDQEGLAMMMYTDQHGNDLLKDIKRALKYSIDYQ